MKRVAPDNYSHFHSRRCGTQFRGCAPECPKDIYESTGEWTGPAWPLCGDFRTVPTPGLPGAFGAIRKHDVHTGVDLYCLPGTPVFAINKGVVVAVTDFTGVNTEPPSPWWNDTQAVLIEHEHYVLCYGEIEPQLDLKVQDTVYAGQRIGRVKRVLKKDKGRPTSMLHLEMYECGARNHIWWNLDEPKPESLLDPTPLLLSLLCCPEEGS